MPKIPNAGGSGCGLNALTVCARAPIPAAASTTAARATFPERIERANMAGLLLLGAQSNKRNPPGFLSASLEAGLDGLEGCDLPSPLGFVEGGERERFPLRDRVVACGEGGADGGGAVGGRGESKAFGVQ